MPKYSITKKLAGGFEEAVRKARNSLERENFTISGEFRLDKSLKRSLDVDFRRYAVLSSFYPPLAHKALMVETDIWLLLPNQFIIYEDEGGGVTISVTDPVVAMSMIENPALAILAKEIKERIERAMASIA